MKTIAFMIYFHFYCFKFRSILKIYIFLLIIVFNKKIQFKKQIRPLAINMCRLIISYYYQIICHVCYFIIIFHS